MTAPLESPGHTTTPRWLSRTDVQTLIGAAGMAPSILNTQPWGFDVHGATIDLYADASRGLYWSIDPAGRQLHVSCGAALLNLRVAAAHLGRPAAVELLPDSERPLLLARVELGPRGRGNAADAELFGAIRRRHTHRRPFSPRRIPGVVLGELAACARAEGSVVVPLTRSQREWLYDLAAFAEAVLEESPEYVADVTRWTGGPTSRPDGIPLSAFGTMSTTGSPPMRDFTAGQAGAQMHEPYPTDPWVAVLSTRTDDKVAWLNAGQALERLLLLAANRGLGASFLNQPLDDRSIRGDLASPAIGGFPQMILRVGYAAGDPPTPRRPIESIAREP
jgi:nitroreductase